MFRISLRSSLLALSLGFILASGASAAPLPWGGFFSDEGAGLLSRLEVVFLGGVNLKHGCSIDPNGNPVCAPKLGCSIDPNGTPKCPPTVTPKRGCTIDPNGSPVCVP